MSSMMTRVSPWATTMIRMDHTQLMATFHRYRVDASTDHKRAVADSLCAALEIHAKLEEEIFYPAMRRFDPDLVDKSVPEHNEMRRLIARLRELEPDDPSFDSTAMELMRGVIRHVADEETMLLPDAERVLADRLGELGAQMTRRRVELAGRRAAEIAIDAVRTYPAITLAVCGALVAGVSLAAWALMRPRARRALPVAKVVRKLAAPRRLRAMTSRLASAIGA